MDVDEPITFPHKNEVAENFMGNHWCDRISYPQYWRSSYGSRAFLCTFEIAFLFKPSWNLTPLENCKFDQAPTQFRLCKFQFFSFVFMLCSFVGKFTSELLQERTKRKRIALRAKLREEVENGNDDDHDNQDFEETNKLASENEEN